MGYTTDFNGSFKLNKPLGPKLKEYLTKFNITRRMKRKMDGYGVDGEFFVDGKGDFGQDHDLTIVDYNQPPITQPGLWCHWTPNEAGTEIVWDEGEKFYDYIAWLKYIIVNFLAPDGYILSGEVSYQGEDNDDFGMIRVDSNVVQVAEGKRAYKNFKVV